MFVFFIIFIIDTDISDNESKNERRLIEFRNTKSQSTDVDQSYRRSPTPFSPTTLSPPATKFGNLILFGKLKYFW